MSKRSSPRQHVFGRFGLVAAGLVAATLGACSSSTSRESAREQATSATCQRFNMCAPFPSTSYPSMDACVIDWTAKWDQAWPAADCDGKIDESQLSTCLSAINGTACNIVDFFSTLGKCGKANVCHTASPDGG